LTQQGSSTVSLESSGTNAGLLGRRNRAFLPTRSTRSTHSTPRLALDVFILSNITLGGSIGYASTTARRRVTAPKAGAEVTLPTSAPRLRAARSAASRARVGSGLASRGITTAPSIDQDSKPQQANDAPSTTSLSWSQTTSRSTMLVVTPTPISAWSSDQP